MKKIYVFNQHAMNGTVSMHTEPCATTTRELAEKTRNKIMEIWAKNKHPYLRMQADEIQEVEVFESESEVPILNRKEDDDE